jgi:ribonucleoside-diphosphate reductase alpha chain
MRGGSEPEARGASNVTAIASMGPTARTADTIEGAVALKQETQHDLSPTERLEKQAWSRAGTATAAVAQPSKAERRQEAKAKGYEGEMCGECGNFTLVRNGTCMKCDTCGSTSGCS